MAAALACGSEATARKDLWDTLRFFFFFKKKNPKRKSCPGWSATRVVHYGSGSTVLCCAGLDSTRTGVRQNRVHVKLTQAKDGLLKILVQARCADGGNGGAPYLAHLISGIPLDKGDRKSGVKALRLIHMFCTWWKAFKCSSAPQPSRDALKLERCLSRLHRWSAPRGSNGHPESGDSETAERGYPTPR